MMGAVSWYAFVRLGRNPVLSKEQQLMRLFFAVFTASTVAGAFFGHAFLYKFPFAMKLPAWLLSMVAMSILERVSLLRYSNTLDKRTEKLLLQFNVVKWVFFAAFVASTIAFPMVQVHMAVCMLAVMAPMEWLQWKRRRDQASRLLLLSILPAIGAALVGVVKYGPCVWFVHHDIAHVFVCGSLWYMMLATENMQVAEAATAQANAGV
jgi:hypothetical protein